MTHAFDVTVSYGKRLVRPERRAAWFSWRRVASPAPSRSGLSVSARRPGWGTHVGPGGGGRGVSRRFVTSSGCGESRLEAKGQWWAEGVLGEDDGECAGSECGGGSPVGVHEGAPVGSVVEPSLAGGGVAERHR